MSSVTPIDWGGVVVRIWLLGIGVMMFRLLAGIAWAALMVRRATDLPHTGWLDSLDDAAAALRLTRPVALKVSDRITMPTATGLWRAAILLPASAIGWPEERRRVVLQHELAHVKRRDCVMQALAQAACAVHWFNPAAHLAVARLRAEQERACDDMVLAIGTDARDYADHLFAIAVLFRASSFPSWAGTSMARPSELEGRMLAILDAARARRVPSRRVRVALTMLAVVAAVPFGALRLGAQQAPLAEAAPHDDVRMHAPASETGRASAGEAVADSAPADGRRLHVVGATDVVHGNIDDLDLLALTPAMRVAEVMTDAVSADVTIDVKAIVDHVADSLSANLGGHRIIAMAQAGATAAAAAAQRRDDAVTDETKKRVADALASALGDDNPQVRQQALSALASMRDERALPGLVRALGDTSPEVRMRALGALMQFDSPAAVDGVFTALKDRSPQVRAQAARQLSAMIGRGRVTDAKYADALVALLKDENPDVREQAASALGRLRQPSSAGPLTQALRDSSADVREQAARALGQVGGTDAVPALSALLKDPSKDVREQAADALGNIADPRAIDALTAALKDTEPSVREQAARALGQIARGQRRDVRPLRQTPPTPPVPPQAFIDREALREIEQRARDAAEDARREVERAMRDLPRGRVIVPAPDPSPVPAPAVPLPPDAPVPPR